MTAHAVLIIGLVAVFGMALGSINIMGVRLGVAGVLFIGLIFGHFGLSIDHTVLEFSRDFGLILFVYTIGLQIGPGFASSLKKQGLPLNILAAFNVGIGVLTTILLGRLLLPKTDFPAIVGVFCGASTSTPSLAAATQATLDILPSAAKLPALGYAIAYPFGVIGIILTMFFIRWAFKIDLKAESHEMDISMGGETKKLDRASVEVTNLNFQGVTLSEMIKLINTPVVVSRIMHNENTTIATGSEVICVGDVILAVGTPAEITRFITIAGRASEFDLTLASDAISTRFVLVTQNQVLGKSVPELALAERFGVAITRINRGEIEMPASEGVKIMFGDRVRMVGPDAGITAAAKEFGDSVQQHDHPMIIPMLLSMAVGVFIGSIPLQLPGFPEPVSLGLAGGPLLVAIIFGRIGKIGPLVWYMPRSANLTLRYLGISLFLACVGLKAGDQFVQTLVHGHGLEWMGVGVILTAIPLVSSGICARVVAKLNYLPLCGLLAGCSTDTAALAFAGMVTGSEVPSVAYASVYPTVMILRILAAQAMILFFR